MAVLRHTEKGLETKRPSRTLIMLVPGTRNALVATVRDKQKQGGVRGGVTERNINQSSSFICSYSHVAMHAHDPRHRDHEFKVRLGYLMRLSLRNQVGGPANLEATQRSHTLLVCHR